MNKIYERDYYYFFRTAAEQGLFDGFGEEITPEMILEFCDKKIEEIDEKKMKSAAAAAEKRNKPDELRELVASLLTGELQNVADLLIRINDEEITASKVVNRLSGLVRDGVAEKSQVTIPAVEEGGRSRRVQAYKLA